MKYLILISISILSFISSLFAQTIPLEIMGGQRNFWYQHVMGKGFENSKFGHFHVSSLHAFYDATPHELMSQSYLTYQINAYIKPGIGLFYSSAPSFAPSINIQLMHKGKNHFILAIPRIDVVNNPSYDVMVMTEYFPKLTHNTALYTRIQVMLNYTGTQHNRSYQNIRAGIDLGTVQLGVAANFDAYGKRIQYQNNYGLFVRKMI
jgi:hypothetical protein